jgi:predicted transposase YbfD/YdcC
MSDHITLEASVVAAIGLDVNVLMAYLEGVTDQRHGRGKRYSLSFLLAVIILAKLAGQHRPSAIAQWVKLRREELVTAFHCQRKTVPALNTIRRVLSDAVMAAELLTILNRFLHEAYGGQQSVQVTLDGKTLRGTIAQGQSQGEHIVTAFLPGENVALTQVSVDSKENELVAAPKVLAELELHGRVVTGDALFTQRNLSVQVLARGGHYLWLVKDNQRHLRDNVGLFFVPPRKAPGWYSHPLPQTTAQTVDKAHGRLEVRTLTAVVDETGFLDWPGVRQVFRLVRQVTCLATGAVTIDQVLGITSLPPERAAAGQLLDFTRHHWQIENGLHYRRDVSLQEDSTRMVNRRQAQSMAALNNFIVGLVAKLGFTNLAYAQRQFEARLTLALAAV